MTLTYRNVKGTELSYNELDTNFADLDTRTGEGWRDMLMGLDTRGGPNSAVLTSFRNGIYLYGFSNTVNQEIFATAHINHDWKTGSNLYPHLHFSVDTVNTGVVRWGIEYTAAQRSQGAVSNFTFGPTNVIYMEQGISGVAYNHYVTEVSDLDAIQGANLDVDSVILFRFFRDSEHENDTFPDQVFGITADLHYQANRSATPNKVAPFL